MKKMIALTVCFCILGCMLVSTVSAAGGLSLSTSAPQIVECGQEIELVYTFSSINTKGICGLDMEISFDDSLVEFVSVSLSSFPEGASWIEAGHVSGSTYYLHAFDDYVGNEPVSIYDGTNASITVKFKALEKAVGTAVFSTDGFGAVMGCYFENGATKTYNGTSNSVSVIIKGFVKDCVGTDYAIKDGNLLVLPGCTASDLPYEAESVTAADGTAKENDAPLLTGDVVDFGLSYKQSTVTTLGDLNGDGRVTTNDYMMLKMHIKDVKPLPSAALIAADVNMDGMISALDAICFSSILRGYSISLSVAAE